MVLERAYKWSKASVRKLRYKDFINRLENKTVMVFLINILPYSFSIIGNVWLKQRPYQVWSKPVIENKLCSAIHKVKYNFNSVL